MKKISEPQVKVIKFQNVDVIATSGTPEALIEKNDLGANAEGITYNSVTTTWF